jgi:hypothetical protein
MYGQDRDRQNKLGGNGREELGNFAAVAVASFEEETGAKAAAVCELARDSARDGRLAGAGHAVEPEDGVRLRLVSRLVGPFAYLVEETHACVALAGRGSPFSLGVESSRDLVEHYLPINRE